MQNLGNPLKLTEMILLTWGAGFAADGVEIPRGTLALALEAAGISGARALRVRGACVERPIPFFCCPARLIFRYLHMHLFHMNHSY